MITVAIDFETGGLQPYFHEAISVAIVPLNEDFTPDSSREPFISNIGVDHPDRLSPGALKVNGKTAEEIATYPPRKEVVKAFFEWVAPYGKMAPLGQNWSFDKGFFTAFLDPDRVAPEVAQKYFDYRARDLQRVVMYAIDRAKMAGAPLPFGGTSLVKISEKLGIENPAPHTAYGDAVTAALCYSKLVKL